MIRLLIIIIGALFITNIMQAISQNQKRKNHADKNREEITHSNNLKEMPYKDKYILTKNEYIFYLELKKIANKIDWIICPKVKKNI